MSQHGRGIAAHTSADVRTGFQDLPTYQLASLHQGKMHTNVSFQFISHPVVS